jgi:hypothetical protein
MRFHWTVSAAWLLVTLAGCSSTAAVRRLLPPEADGFGRAFLEHLRNGDTVQAARVLSPRLALMPGTTDSLLRLGREFAPGTPDGAEIIGVQVHRQGGVTRRLVTYELHSGGGWTAVDLVLAEELGLRYVDAVNVTRLPASARETNALTFARAGPAHYLTLLLALLSAGYALAAVVRVARTPMRHRWWWAALALVGAGQLGVVWTTGEVFTSAVRVQLFPVSFARFGLAGPWILTVAFPAGAMVALQRRRRALAAAAPGEESAVDANTVEARTSISPRAPGGGAARERRDAR